ncbi:MAG: type II toxin-antitoxin system VapB family antitoxin [Salinibacter sp.]
MARMTVSIDDELLADARRLSGAKTKRQTIEVALKHLVQRLRAREIADHAGRVPLALTQEELQDWREAR